MTEETEVDKEKYAGRGRQREIMLHGLRNWYTRIPSA